MKDKEVITLAEGSGGKEMQELIESFKFTYRGKWRNFDNDSATLEIHGNKKLFFTTDSFTVNPIFFPGGDIGHLAFSGTVNDLLVLGANPLGLSLSLVIEEGFPRSDLEKIIKSIDKLSKRYRIPVVTGDTKVMERGKIDKIVVNTSGVGIAGKEEELTRKVSIGDKVIISGGVGEHAVALLSKRFDYKTKIVSDSKPLIEEINSVKKSIKVAKDPTRGGIAAALNELCIKCGFGMLLNEESIPVKPQVKKVAEMLGLDFYELACEGCFVCVASEEKAGEVEEKLRRYNRDARIIGEITRGNKVVVETMLGERILHQPSGRIVPRIC